MERTLVLIKPDAITKNIIGKIINFYEENNLCVEDIKMIQPTKEILEKHYEEHKEKPFFEELISSMELKKIVAIIITGENAVSNVRKINGSTDPTKADEGTIRNLFGSNVTQNTVHGSANPNDAEREIKIWFNS